MDLSRRHVLTLGGAAFAGATLAPAGGLRAPSLARAQAPKRGGTLSLRLWDPPHFDPHLTISYKTNVAYSFTHSRLIRHKAGPGVTPLPGRSRSRATSPSRGAKRTKPRTSSSCAAAYAGIPSRR